MFISVEEIEVMENSGARMWCDVPFDLPNDIEVIWRFAEEVCPKYNDRYMSIAVKISSPSLM